MYYFLVSWEGYSKNKQMARYNDRSFTNHTAFKENPLLATDKNTSLPPIPCDVMIRAEEIYLLSYHFHDLLFDDFRSEGFYDIIRSPCLQRLHNALLFSLCCDHDHRYAFGAIVFLDFLQKRKTIHVRHMPIEKNEPYIFFLREDFHSLDTIRSLDRILKSGLFQTVCQNSPHRTRIVNDKNFHSNTSCNLGTQQSIYDTFHNLLTLVIQFLYSSSNLLNFIPSEFDIGLL